VNYEFELKKFVVELDVLIILQKLENSVELELAGDSRTQFEFWMKEDAGCLKENDPDQKP
jgi:hypothetical protein